ncbi:MAG TPA: DUF424 family protein [Thermoplasmata archaeon]|nr:DUF424 family protein [Thermoplasmata archaeon]
MGDGIVMRIHQVRSEFVVAACDSELLGRDLPVGTAGRKVKITSQFYGERVVSPEEFVWALRRATIANLLGERTLALATSEGFLAPGAAGVLGGVPHAEIFSVVG